MSSYIHSDLSNIVFCLFGFFVVVVVVLTSYGNSTHTHTHYTFLYHVLPVITCRFLNEMNQAGVMTERVKRCELGLGPNRQSYSQTKSNQTVGLFLFGRSGKGEVRGRGQHTVCYVEATAQREWGGGGKDQIDINGGLKKDHL